LLLLPLVFVGAILFGLELHLATWAPQTSQTNGVLPVSGIPLPSNLVGIVAVNVGVSLVLAPVTFGREFGWHGYL